METSARIIIKVLVRMHKLDHAPNLTLNTYSNISNTIANVLAASEGGYGYCFVVYTPRGTFNILGYSLGPHNDATVKSLAMQGCTTTKII